MCHSMFQLWLNEKALNVWVSFRSNENLNGQKILYISPMFILRNLLSEPVLLNVTGRDTNDHHEIVSEGKGKETQVAFFTSNFTVES